MCLKQKITRLYAKLPTLLHCFLLHLIKFVLNAWYMHNIRPATPPTFCGSIILFLTVLPIVGKWNWEKFFSKLKNKTKSSITILWFATKCFRFVRIYYFYFKNTVKCVKVNNDNRLSLRNMFEHLGCITKG